MTPPAGRPRPALGATTLVRALGAAVLTIHAAATALCLASAAFPASAQASPAEFLPVRHAAYEEIEALASLGLLDSLAVYTRPLARTDVARALDRARRLHPGVERNLHFQRLERELGRELSDLGIATVEPETGPAVDLGPREQRFRISAAGHLRGDFDDKREAAHFRVRDESAASARMSLQLGSAFGAFEEIGITRIRGQRVYIDAIALHSDLEASVLRGELTARGGALTAAAGLESFRWGPGRRGSLLLADAAGPMTFLMLQGNAGGRVTGTALSAVVSAADNRYLAAHRIEIAASPRLTLGFAEAVRYRAEGIDVLYATGLIPYAIVERIRIRDASTDSIRAGERANVMASADFVVRFSPALALYGELLVDDYASESNDMPNRIGYQAGIRSERAYGDHYVHMRGEYTRVRNYTYSVDYGQDFIYRDRPLGFALGPDVENVLVETTFDVSRDWQLRWSGDFTNHGEGRLGLPWYQSQGGVSTAGLLGVVEERREVWGDARWMPRDNVDVSLGVGFRRIRNENNLDGHDRESWLGRVAAELRY